MADAPPIASMCASSSGAALQLGDLRLDDVRAVEDVFEFQQVGLVGQHLLHAERPLLIPRARQAKRLVPGRQLHRAGARALGKRDRQRLQQDAIDVVLRLLLGETERVHLHAIAEAAELFVLNAITLTADLVPEVGERAHLAELGDEAHARVHEERDAREDERKSALALTSPRAFTSSSTAIAAASANASLLLRRRAGFLQMIGAHVHRIPFRHRVEAPGDGVGGEL